MKTALVLLLAGASTAAIDRSPVSAPKAPAPLHITMPRPGPGAVPPPQTRRLTPAARLPGFAPELAEMPRIDGPGDWGDGSEKRALASLSRAKPTTRQAARWLYAKALIANGRHADALGVLEVMGQDDPDLLLVANFQIARGVVLANLGRPVDALEALGREELAGNAEACLWRAQSLADMGAHEEALREAGCARAALLARAPAKRVPFLAAIAESALAKDQPAHALQLLKAAPDDDAAANILRGRAHAAMRRFGEARIRFGRAEHKGNEPQRYEARMGLIEMAIAQKSMPAKDARRELDRIRFVWRGGAVEEQALRLSYKLAKDAKDARAAISAGTTLIRYFELGAELPPLLIEVQAQLAALLAPDNRMPIDQAAGLYWDYRDLVPAGGEGDALVIRLANRLQAAGLYARAAELLEHQLRHRALDIAQGPLSVRVARLHILAGHADLALAAIHDTEQTIFPREMLWSRARVQAVALHQLGKTDEALAVLQDVPGASGLRAELLWKRGDWGRLVAASAPDLPGAGALSEVKQAVVLRYAIALGMLGREAELAGLRSRYEARFAGLPTAPVFDLLTSEAGSIDPESLTRAMSAIPTASPAGEFADLLDIAPARQKRG